MSALIEDLPAVLDFVKRTEAIGILSTGAKVVDYTGGLYNVSGSTHDPKAVKEHRGRAWKALLIEYGINAASECYVTGDVPAGTSHPIFRVGGQMTPNEDGTVTNGICYLMPLCGWHNSTSKNGVLFKHEHTKMLRLTGYLEGELEVTFKMRLPSADPYAMLFQADGEWKFQNLSEKQLANVGKAALTKSLSTQPDHYVLFKRVREEKTHYALEDVKLLGA